MFALCVHYYLNTACEISGSWSVIFWFILFFFCLLPPKMINFLKAQNITEFSLQCLLYYLAPGECSINVGYNVI